MKIIHPICLKFAVIFLLFYTAAWSRQRPLSGWSWHGRNDFRLLINRTWKLLAKVFKWSPIVCLLLLTVIKNPAKYECGSLRVKISECGRFYTPAGSDRQVEDFWNFVVCAGDFRTKREGWQVWLCFRWRTMSVQSMKYVLLCFRCRTTSVQSLKYVLLCFRWRTMSVQSMKYCFALFQMENNVCSAYTVCFALFQMENNVCSAYNICFALFQMENSICSVNKVLFCFVSDVEQHLFS